MSDRAAARQPDPPAHRPVLTSVSRTHIGHVRKLNEDRLLDRADRALWAVADGMGGHHGGDVAAELAIDCLRRLANDDRPFGGDAIRSALERANGEIHRRALAIDTMIGSTVVVLHIDGLRADVFWAGDSRAYLVREGQRRLVTSDHSVVQELVDAGAIGAAEASRHPHAHLVTRALGAEATISIETVSVPLQPGDQLLLCSDGLSRTLAAAAAQDMLGAGQGAADRMLAEALRADGQDNISLVLVAIDDGEPEG